MWTGSCRALTSRIPQSKVAILSGIASASLAEAINEPQPCIKVWTLDERYNVRASHIVPEPVTIRADLAGWSVYMDSGALARARTLRAQCLPAETGGVLLGVADRTDKSIRIVEALPAPQDSIGSAHGFERGIRDLEHTLARIGLTTLDQLRYVGEWHSHPQAHTALPSRADIAQAAWLREQLRAEQLPALMLIVADQTESIVIAS